MLEYFVVLIPPSLELYVEALSGEDVVDRKMVRLTHKTVSLTI